jgi:hypothetical protein
LAQLGICIFWLNMASRYFALACWVVQRDHQGSPAPKGFPVNTPPGLRRSYAIWDGSSRVPQLQRSPDCVAVAQSGMGSVRRCLRMLAEIPSEARGI